jgi:anti-sigma factor RsiW
MPTNGWVTNGRIQVRCERHYAHTFRAKLLRSNCNIASTAQLADTLQTVGQLGWRWRHLSLAIALSSSATWFALHDQKTDKVLVEVLDTHMRSLIAAKPMDVESSDRHTVKPWFNGRLPQAPCVVDLASEGFPLKGARIDFIAAAPVPTLVYSRRLHVISVFATRTSESISRPARTSFKGYNVVHWIDGAITYWVASDLNARELDTFARLFRDAPS